MRPRPTVSALLLCFAAPAFGQAPPRKDFIDSRWTAPTARFFLGTTTDVGAMYGRPRVSLGYGRPHRHWAGIEASPTFNGNAYATYGGVRYAHPIVDFRAGARYSYSLFRSYLPIRDSYGREDIFDLAGGNAHYWTLESELAFDIPVGPGAIVSETAEALVQGVPDDRYVYEETVHVVVAPRYFARQRLGYLLKLTSDGTLRIGAVGELVLVPEREDGKVIRAGVILRHRLFDDLELRINMVPAIVSPDHMGAAGGDFGEFGLRWLWATP